MLLHAHNTQQLWSCVIKGTKQTNSLSIWIYFGILRLGFTKSVIHWHLKKPKLFQRARSGKLNNMFLWTKACRSISKPLAMLRLEIESARFHWLVFFGEWVCVRVCLAGWMSLFVLMTIHWVGSLLGISSNIIFLQFCSTHLYKWG